MNKISNHSYKNTEQGFTLIEIMLSIALLSMVVFMTINILSNEFRILQKVNERYPFDKIMNRISKDLEGAYLLANNPRDEKFHFVYSPPSSLVFSIVNNRSLVRNTKESNLAQIRYFVQSRDDKRQLVRIVDTKMEENKNILTPGVGVSTVLAEDIKDFEVKFWKQDQFIDSWDSAQNELGLLPKMAKVILILYLPQQKSSDPKQELKLETITYLTNSAGQPTSPTTPFQPASIQPGTSAPLKEETSLTTKQPVAERYEWQ